MIFGGELELMARHDGRISNFVMTQNSAPSLERGSTAQ
jgi:hypothetical protein